MDIYNKKWLDELLDDDEINEQEEGFMHGYLEAFKKDQVNFLSSFLM